MVFMSYQTSEAILLRAIPYRDHDAILTLLTPNGKISVVKKGWQNGVSPLTHVDITYFVGRSDLYNCRSLSILNPHLSLRKSLATLEAACEMMKAAHAVSVPNQDFATIFHLLLQGFEQLPYCGDPQSLVDGFYLQLLEAEGLLPPNPPSNIKDLFYNSIS